MYEKSCHHWNYRNDLDVGLADPRRCRRRSADRPSQVDETVRTLEASGYNVIINRSGAAPLSQCTVSTVRPGQTYSTTDSRGGSSIHTTITSKTVYVDVTC